MVVPPGGQGIRLISPTQSISAPNARSPNARTMSLTLSRASSPSPKLRSTWENRSVSSSAGAAVSVMGGDVWTRRRPVKNAAPPRD
jgi:hypothetical protein